MDVVGLFAGIGGIERGLGSQFETVLFCENNPAAAAVLRRRFPRVPVHPDVRTLRGLADGASVVTAGFPCTDLSQAGRTRGIRGSQSGLVDNVFRLLTSGAGRRVDWLLIENVRNMLVLDKGEAMRHITSELEALDFAWAYRVVDTRSFGLPQRRQRVILVASRVHDPRPVLFSDDAGEPGAELFRDDAFGFYWTEGLRGLGWAPDAVPTLKGGSTIGIPSPPAVWLPLAEDGAKFVTPSIGDAERLQGFPDRWTDVGPSGHRARSGLRWKLVGNAVSVPVARWLGRRLHRPPRSAALAVTPLSQGERWPIAAYGAPGSRRFGVDASMWPVRRRYHHLADFLDSTAATPLSRQAAAGFLARLERGRLNAPEDFRLDLKRHIEFLTRE